MTKKYVMITGSSHSGSTILGAILGNYENHNGLDVGEIYALLDPEIHIHNPVNAFWRIVKDKTSKDTLLEFLFNYVDCVVDSSKILSWFKLQRKIAYDLDIQVQHVHVFRHPVSWRKSRIDRNQEGDYRYYIEHNTIPLNWNQPDVIVYLPDLRENPEKYIEKLCEKLNIQYWDKKHEYWNTSIAGLFGSIKARNSTEIMKPIPPDDDIYVPDEVIIVYNDLMEIRLK